MKGTMGSAIPHVLTCSKARAAPWRAPEHAQDTGTRTQRTPPKKPEDFSMLRCRGSCLSGTCHGLVSQCFYSLSAPPGVR